MDFDIYVCIVHWMIEPFIEWLNTSLYDLILHCMIEYFSKKLKRIASIVKYILNTIVAWGAK